MRRISGQFLGFLVLALAFGCGGSETKPKKKPTPKALPKAKKEIRAYIAGNPKEISALVAKNASSQEAELEAAIHGYGKAVVADRLGHPRARDEANGRAVKRMQKAARAICVRFCDDFKNMTGYPADGPIERWRKSREGNDTLAPILERLAKYKITVARHKPKSLPAPTTIFVTFEPAKLFELLGKDLSSYLKGAGGRPYDAPVRAMLQKEYKNRANAVGKNLLLKQRAVAKKYGFNGPH